jgi:protein-disulfide isomerase
VSAWVPRTLLALGIAAVVAAVISIAVGEGGPGEPQDVGGINDVQRILGGIHQAGAHLGSDDAPVTVTVFNDIQCAPCAEFQIEVVDRVVEDYVRTDRARLEFRHFSLAPNEATLAAIGAEAAAEQDRQWQFVDTFVRNQGLVDERGVTEDLLREIAETVSGLELEQWEEDFDDPAARDRIHEDAALANSLELPADPAVVVSGAGGQVELIETPSYDEIEAAIAEVS